MERQITGTGNQRLDRKCGRIDGDGDDIRRLIRFVRSGQWAWAKVGDESWEGQEPVVFPHVERVERHVEDRWIVDLSDSDSEGLSRRAIDVWRGVRTVVKQAYSNQDGPGVEDVHIGS